MNRVSATVFAASLIFADATLAKSPKSPVKVEIVPPTTFHPDAEGYPELDPPSIRTTLKKLFHLDVTPMPVHQPLNSMERVQRGVPAGAPPVWERFRMRIEWGRHKKPETKSETEKPLPGLLDRATGKPVSAVPAVQP